MLLAVFNIESAKFISGRQIFHCLHYLKMEVRFGCNRNMNKMNMKSMFSL